MVLETAYPKCLARFAQHLWLEQCTKLAEVEASLEFAKTNADDQFNWLPFVQFLGSQCSGPYSDKQWSELLNLMQISRRLNHRTVKFGDILTNRASIELNASKICQFNQVIRTVKLIESLLERLEPVLAECHLYLSNEASQLLGQVDACKSQLQERCQPVMSALRVEMASQLVANHADRDIWLARFDKFERQYEKLDLFLTSLSELELKIDQLRPLVNVQQQTQPEPGSVAIAASKLNSSLELCKQKFAKSHSYREQLVNKLHTLASEPVVVVVVGVPSSKQQIRSRKQSSQPTKSNQLQLPLLKLLVHPSKQTVAMASNLFDTELAAKLRDLTNCQLGLDKIMQTLRLEFGRFYFLSDLELLEVVSQDTKLLSWPVQKQPDASDTSRRLISKIYGNSISSLLISPDDSNLVVGIESPHGEQVYFHASEQPSVLKKKVNIFSLEIIRVMLETSWKLRRTLKRLLEQSLANRAYDSQIDWSLPVQLLVLSEQIKFCNKVEQNLTSAGSKIVELMAYYQQRLDKLKTDARIESGTRLMQLKMLAGISMTVQFLSTLSELEGCHVGSPSDWNWLKQLRFKAVTSCDDKQETVVKVLIANMSFDYKFDYLPLQLVQEQNNNNNTKAMQFKRLITTEITQRCLLAACHSLCHLKLGASPFGPAGSGKTETIKALGNSLGCQVIVHNCDQSNEAKSLNRLIWGLAQTGLWGCFDEFNRLGLATLSSVSASLELVQSSIREDKRSVELPDGTIMPLDPDSAFFITLNPIDKKRRYKGRRRLPSNLRGLFQPISMVRIPIDTIIVESLMLLSGFDDATIGVYKQAAGRLNTWLQQMATKFMSRGLCEWDLRLVVAILKRIQASNKQSASLDATIVDSVEAEVKPRFACHDWEQMQVALRATFDIATPDKTLEARHDDDKISALASQLETRIGVLLLGPSKAGKSHTWRQLLKASKPNTIDWTVLNPRACSPSELLGRLDSGDSQRWIDGLLSAKVRQALTKLSHTPQLEQFWLVLDGPVDPDWIESLNSVLDDNQVLTLGSGERLGFVPNASQSIKLIIETDSIEMASPATISRLGLVLHPTPYLGQSTSGPYGTIKLEIVEDPVSSNAKCYYCSPASNSSHLLRLFAKLKDSKQHLVIGNLDMVQPENQWASSSFIELLRYSVTYEENLCDQITIIVKDLSKLDQRMQSLANQVTKQTNLVDRKPFKAISVDDLVLELAQTNEQKIVLLHDDYYNFYQSNAICQLLAQHFEVVHRFCNSKLANESVTNLAKLLDTNAIASSQKWPLFFVSFLELCLMPNEIRAELFHLASLLRMDSNCKAKIIVYAPDQNAADPDELSYISTVAQIYSMMKDQKRAANKLSDTLRLEGRQLSWLETKLASINNERQEASIKATFPALYSNFLNRLTSQKQILTNGLARLSGFGRQVERVGAICERDESNLKTKQLEMDKLMVTIDEALKDSKDRQTKVESLRELSSSKETEIKAKRLAVESELAVVRPLLDSSKQEVNQHLVPEALNEIKALRSPPKTVKDVLDVLFVFLGMVDTSWQSIKGYLTRNSLRDELNNYDFRKQLTANLLRKVQLELDKRKESFDLQQAARASRAIVPIVHWIQAAMNFGRVILKLQPLEAELEAMKVEQDELEEARKSTEHQLAEIEAKKADLSQKLAELKRDNEKAKEEVEAIRAKLSKATQVQKSLESQISRWSDKLKQIDSMLEMQENSNQVLKLSLLASAMQQFASFSEAELLKWANFCDLSALGTDDSIHLLYQLSMDTKLGRDEAKPKDFCQTGELLMVRSCLMANRLVPFIDVGSELDQLDWRHVETSIGKATSSGVSVIPLTSESFEAIELANSLDKVAIIRLGSGHSKSLDLDLVDCITRIRQHNRASLDGRLILLGDSKYHNQMCSQDASPVSVMKLASVHNLIVDHGQLERRILDRLIAIEDSQLSLNVQRLETELANELNVLQSREMTLIERLAQTGETNAAQQVDDDLDLDRQLVATLAELHELNENSKRDVKRLELELEELSSKKNNYLELANQAASFYSKYLSQLGNKGQDDNFCRVTVDNFLAMLHLNDSGRGGIDFPSIIKKVLRPMKPDERKQFIDMLGTTSELASSVNQTDLQLEQVVKELRTDGPSTRLLVALHDPNKSSPQLELDDLLRNTSSDPKINYHKMYATGDNDSQLETKLRELDAFSCVCIANAHLAFNWCNSNLVQIIKSNQSKCMIILVAEADETQQFEPEVLGLCTCRFWYDELASSLDKRFELLLRALTKDRRFESVFVDQAKANLASQIVLFHVVCQEKTKFDASSGGWSMASYRFDHDQLTSAMEMLIRISRDSEFNIEAWSLQLSNYVSEVIYGPRMETKVDEIEMDKVARTFLDISSGVIKMKQLKSVTQQVDIMKFWTDLVTC